MQSLSERTAGFTDSVIRRMTRVSMQYDAVNLSQGFPDFEPPKKLLDRLAARRTEGLTTPKQIRLLEQRGFRNVGTWTLEQAKQMIDRIAANRWHVPRGVNPQEYIPE